jgi:hypothetical protein
MYQMWQNLEEFLPIKSRGLRGRFGQDSQRSGNTLPYTPEIPHRIQAGQWNGSSEGLPDAGCGVVHLDISGLPERWH